MIMNIKTAVFCLSLCMVLAGCDVMKQVGGAYNMTQCKYNYNSISQLTLSGIDMSRGVSITSLPAVLSILSGQATSIPMNFNLNLDVSNPNATEAMLHGVEYILSIDNVQFTSGSMNQSLMIPSGGQQMLPIRIGIDLVTLMKGETKDAVTSIVENFIGIGSRQSNVTLQLKPTFMVGNIPVTSPMYIPVSFSFGGGK